MIILGIESSCDETAAAIVKDGHDILSNVVVSQINIFKAYGGVIPEVAARSHLEAILPVIHKALDDAFPDLPEAEQWDKIDAISVTHTPGLLGSLLIGTLTARTLAILHNKPFYPIHHLKSHIYATWLNQHTTTRATANNKKAKYTIFENTTANPASELQHSRVSEKARHVTRENMVASPATGMSFLQVEHRSEARTGTDLPKKDIPVHGTSQPILESNVPSFPLIALVVSGGHTQIIHMKKHNDFEIIGTTRDDAVGECFDKVAKILGLPYPGGPSISNAALGHITLQSGETLETAPGDRHKYPFPHPKLTHPPRTKTPTSPTPCLDFSFSGLKTAVLRTVQNELGVPISFPSHDLPKKILELKDSARFIADFSASFEQTAIDILLETLKKALTLYPSTTSIVIAGGVSANTLLREEAIRGFSGYRGAYERAIAPSAHDDGPDGRGPEKPSNCFFPDKSFSSDNAAMVASAAYYEIEDGTPPTDPYSLTLLPRSPIS